MDSPEGESIFFENIFISHVTLRPIAKCFIYLIFFLRILRILCSKLLISLEKITPNACQARKF
jgi:hypothetical protein